MRFANGSTLWATPPRVDRLFASVTGAFFRPNAQPPLRGGMAGVPSRDMIVPPCRQLSVLLSSTQPDDRKALVEMLGRAGHCIVVIDEGKTILDVPDTDEFSLILADIDMPAMDGVDVIKLYRFISLGRPYVPIVAIVPDAAEREDRRYKAAGIDACISRPIDRQTLLRIVEALVPTFPEDFRRTSNVREFELADSSGRDDPRAPVVDFRVLNELKALGGLEFVEILVTEFLEDIPNALSFIQAAAGGNAEAFYQQLHILRSASANVGAWGLVKMCSTYCQGSIEGEVEQNEMRLRELCNEFERVRIVIEQWICQHKVPAEAAVLPEGARAQAADT